MISSVADYVYVSIPSGILINGGILPLRDIASERGSATVGDIDYWHVLRGEDPAYLREFGCHLWYAAHPGQTTPSEGAYSTPFDRSMRLLPLWWVSSEFQSLAQTSGYTATDTESASSPYGYGDNCWLNGTVASIDTSRAIFTSPYLSTLGVNQAYRTLTSGTYFVRQKSLVPISAADMISPTTWDARYSALLRGDLVPLDSDDVRSLFLDCSNFRCCVNPSATGTRFLSWAFANAAGYGDTSVIWWASVGSGAHPAGGYANGTGQSALWSNTSVLYQQEGVHHDAMYASSPWQLWALVSVQRYQNSSAVEGAAALVRVNAGTALSWANETQITPAFPSLYSTVMSAADATGLTDYSSLSSGGYVFVSVAPVFVIATAPKFGLDTWPTSWHWPTTDYKQY